MKPSERILELVGLNLKKYPVKEGGQTYEGVYLGSVIDFLDEEYQKNTKKISVKRSQE